MRLFKTTVTRMVVNKHCSCSKYKDNVSYDNSQKMKNEKISKNVIFKNIIMLNMQEKETIP